MKLNSDFLEIKKLTPEYYDENLKLLNTIINESHFLARNEQISQEENQNFIDTYLEHPDTTYLIALYEGQLIGNMGCLPRFEGLLRHIASIGYIVHSDYRKKGIATLLIEKLLEKIKKIGSIKILTAEVALDNIASIRLLKKFGFIEYGRIKNGFMIGKNKHTDLLSFSKHLIKKKKKNNNNS